MNKVYKFIFLVIPVLFALIIDGCTKVDTTSLGQDLIPPIDGVVTKVTDTFTITTENGIFNDSSRADKDDDYMLGQLVTDPIFGRTDASIYTELKPGFQFSWRAKKDSITSLPNGGYDSSFLNLSFFSAGLDKGIYGDSNSTISVNVWAITDNTNFKKDSSYLLRADPNIPHGVLLGTSSFRPADLKNEQIAILKRDTIRNHHMLRVKLTTGAATTMVKNLLAEDTTGVFNSDASFRNSFKGFVIEPTGSGGNAIIKVALNDIKTRFEVWYRFKNGTGGQDTTVDAFPFTYLTGHPYLSASANYIKRTTAGAPFLNYLTPGADTVIALQTTPGTFAKIRIPYLKSFPNKIIHRAELIMEEDPSFSHPFYTQPLNLYIDAFDTAANKFRTVPFDFYFLDVAGTVDFTYFGGQRNIVTDGLGQRARYTFNISKYMQGMVSRNDQYYDLRLYAPYNTRFYNQFVADGFPWPLINSPVFGRVVLGGGSSTRYKMKLRVVYSNI